MFLFCFIDYGIFVKEFDKYVILEIDGVEVMVFVGILIMCVV